MKKRISIGLIILIILIQFIPVNKNQDTGTEGIDILSYSNVALSSPVANILKTSCYACHSNMTSYPWYNNIAPISWYLAKHINNGKKHLNFSTWEYLDEAKRIHKIDECIEMISANNMPLFSYQIMHQEAKLSEGQKKILIKFFESL